MNLKNMFCCAAIFCMVCLSVSVYLTFSVWSVERHVDGRELLSGSEVDRKTLQKNGQAYLTQSDNDHGKCTEKQNFVFIKCMKCATETMATVFRRFGYARNLSFVTPVKDKLYLGWPFLMQKYDYRPSSKGYNIIMEHSIYNKTIMENLMPKDTVYISIIREPFSHVKSSFNYWRIFEVADVKAADPLSEYLNNLEKYEAIYKSPEKHVPRYCIPDGFSMTKNLLSHCLGMPLGFPSGREDISRDQEAVQRYIEQLDEDFYLIMLVEYFHESLVLLKRKMCWTFHDILYKTVNYKDYTFKEKEPHLDLVNIYRNWSSIDYQLYDHFNRTFWKQMKEQTSDFVDEVAEYTVIQANVTRFCDFGATPKFSTEDSKWSPGFSMVRDDCKSLWPDILRRIQARHNLEEKDLLEKDDALGHPGPQNLC